VTLLKLLGIVALLGLIGSYFLIHEAQLEDEVFLQQNHCVLKKDVFGFKTYICDGGMEVVR
jgi:hypothetical protein